MVAAALLSAAQVVSMAQSDTTPPTLSGFSLSASSVNVSTVKQQIIVNASITDDLSGLYYCTIIVQSPSGQLVSAGFDTVSGNSLNGTYYAAVNFPKYAEAGTWSILMDIFDNAGNHAMVPSSTLVSLGFPGTITVVDSTPDITPPTLLGVTFSPTSVNTTLFSASVTVSLHVSDALAGADFTHLINFAVTLSPSDATSFGPNQYLSTADFTLASGTAQNGTWTATKTMPLYSGGSWSLAQVTLYDAVTNRITLTPTQLTAMGITPVLTVTSSSVDITPPSVTGVTFLSTLINTTTASQSVLTNLAVSDDLSGVSFTATTPALTFSELNFLSPSGQQQVQAGLTPLNLLGIPVLGTYQFTTSWPKYSEEGTWSSYYIRISDAVGNARVYTSSALQAAGLSSAISVVQASSTTDGTVTSAGGVVTDDTFGSRASLTFPAGVVSAPTTVTIDVFPSSNSVSTPKGFTTAATYFEDLTFSPALSTPVAAPGITVVLPLVTQMAPGASITLYHVDPVAGTTPAINASGNPVVGTVNSSGTSATFNNVVTFSPLIAFVSTGSILGDVNGDGLVNCADVSIVKSSFGKRTGQAGYNIAADLNSDGVVDIRDLFDVSHQLPAGSTCQ